MEEEPLRTGAEARETDGYGTIRGVIFSTDKNIPTPASSDFYHFTDEQLEELDGYCMACCPDCCSKIYRFESVGVLLYYLQTHESPVSLDGRQLTPVMEGMHQMQGYLDTHGCFACEQPLNAKCTDY